MALFPIKILPAETKINFLGKRWGAFILSLALILFSIFLLVSRGLNLGIDFTGGILIEVRFDKAPLLSDMRTYLKDVDAGDISLQTFGQENNILIRVGHQTGGEKERLQVVEAIKKILDKNIDSNIEYRKVDYVGPKVGSELIRSGSLSLLFAFVAIMIYIWIRFEWQYGFGAILALVHDSILTLGFFSFTQLEFNLSSIAAILTIIGYSINDSVVIFDRIRENFRKFKVMPLAELLNLSINENLVRTVTTSLTTLVALLALVFVGGEVIKSFSLAALFGVLVGTYSSIYIAAPFLIYTKLRANDEFDVNKKSASKA